MTVHSNGPKHITADLSDIFILKELP